MRYPAEEITNCSLCIVFSLAGIICVMMMARFVMGIHLMIVGHYAMNKRSHIRTDQNEMNEISHQPAVKVKTIS